MKEDGGHALQVEEKMGSLGENREHVPTAIAIDFITEQTLRNLSPEARCSMILERLLQSRVIVFEGGLPPQEQTMLITRTMKQIDHETFWGIDIRTHERRKKSATKFFRKNPDLRYTVIRPVHVKVEFTPL